MVVSDFSDDLLEVLSLSLTHSERRAKPECKQILKREKDMIHTDTGTTDKLGSTAFHYWEKSSFRL